ncbi:PDZ domain-containing protein [Streptomyces sp. NPDC005811]|uniref:PDZ domain-containing protein n=1 Tax=Streptomyces sp. NPDC005811 TaxID=3154565 RepID=UPI0033F2FB00
MEQTAWEQSALEQSAWERAAWEQTALRPKPLPGRETGGGAERGGRVGRPRAGRRPARPARALPGLLAGVLLLLSGVGLGTVGAAVIGTSRLAELPRQAVRGLAGHVAPAAAPVAPAPRPVRATLGLEAVDAGRAGARIVAVHVPGPGYAAGLVRGDVLLAFGGTRIDSAADLARAVGEARPGRGVTLTLRHKNGMYRQLRVTPGVVV